MLFRLQSHRNGAISKYKSRLVVKRYILGDLPQTYAPVVEFSTFLLTITVAMMIVYKLHQMDVKTSFLHCYINSDVYISLPKVSGVKVRSRNLLKLNKVLYGLNQAPPLWNNKWRQVALEPNFMQSESYQCLFHCGDVLIMLFVD